MSSNYNEDHSQVHKGVIEILPMPMPPQVEEVIEDFETDENMNKYVGDLYLLETEELMSFHLAGVLFYLEKWNSRLIIRPLEQMDNNTIALAISQIFTDFGQPYVLQSNHDAREMNRIVHELKDIHPGLDILMTHKEEEVLKLLGEQVKNELESQEPKNILYFLKEKQMCWNDQNGPRSDQRTALSELLPRGLSSPRTLQFDALLLQQKTKQVAYRVKGTELSRTEPTLSTGTQSISGTWSVPLIDKNLYDENGPGSIVPSASQSNAEMNIKMETAVSWEEEGQCPSEHAQSFYNNHHRDEETNTAVQNSGCIRETDVAEQCAVEGEILTLKSSTSKRHACSDTEMGAKQAKLTNFDDSSSTYEPKSKCRCRTSCKTQKCSCRGAGTRCIKGVCHPNEPNCDNLAESRDNISDTEIAARQAKLTNFDDSSTMYEPKSKCKCRTNCKTQKCGCRGAGARCTPGVCHPNNPNCDNLSESTDHSHIQFHTENNPVNSDFHWVIKPE